MKTSLLIALALLSTACGPLAERTVPRSQVGTDEARLSTYFMAGGQLEAVPAGIPPEVVRDDAVLALSTPEETCFALTLRTEQAYDAPLDAHVLECAVGSKRAMPVVTNETIAVRDYGPGGAQRVVLAATPAQAFRDVTLEGAGQDFRVLERSASVCCPIRTFDWVELMLVNPRMTLDQGYGPMPYGASYGWRIK